MLGLIGVDWVLLGGKNGWGWLQVVEAWWRWLVLVGGGSGWHWLVLIEGVSVNYKYYKV